MIHTPVFTDTGVLVGYWHVDASGKGRRPVYCLVYESFKYAYLDYGKPILVRWVDFDPLEVFGERMGDDTEHDTADDGDGFEEPMDEKKVRSWVESMWFSKEFCGIA
jgi:hypothetical protein